MKPSVAHSGTPAILPVPPEDAALIRSLAQRIWPVCFEGILTQDQIANMLEKIYSLESLQEQMLEGQRFWVAYCKGKPAGYVSAYKEEGSIWLKKLYCDRAFHGQGIGTAMYRTAVEAFMPAADVRLLVNRENVPAQGYYERLGFKRIDEVPVKMGDFPFVDYLYSKKLQEQ